MATRGTYCFDNKARGFQTNFYIHWDNYPKGAAVYLYEAVKHQQTSNEPSDRCLATCFIKANKTVEFTHSHDYHGDTDYQYDITIFVNKEPTIEVRQIIRDWELDTRYSELYFKGNLYDFVNKELADETEDYPPLTQNNALQG